MLQSISLVERPGSRTWSSTSWFRNIDTTFLTILPRIESSILDYILQVITVCEVIELGDMILFEDILKILLEGTKRSVYLRESPKMVEEPRIEIVR